MNSLQIGIFGGAFDPPHLGHQSIANFMLYQKIVDEVWWTPTGQHAFNKKMSQPLHRHKMVELLIQNQPDQKIYTWELEQEKPSYMLSTLEAAGKAFPNHTFSLIIGSDNATVFKKWHQWEHIIEKYTVYVYPRVGFLFSKVPNKEAFVLLEQAPVVEISSTQVRDLVSRNEDILKLVDVRVAEYCKEHALYI